MPTKRKKIMRAMNGGDVQEWLTMLFQRKAVKYFYNGDEPWASFCILIYGTQPLSLTPEEVEELRNLWLKYREEILRAREEYAPDLKYVQTFSRTWGCKRANKSDGFITSIVGKRA